MYRKGFKCKSLCGKLIVNSSKPNKHVFGKALDKDVQTVLVDRLQQTPMTVNTFPESSNLVALEKFSGLKMSTELVYSSNQALSTAKRHQAVEF